MSAPLLPTDDEQALRELAFKRVKDRRDFQGHLVTYLVVNAFLWGVWAWTSGFGSYPWPVWVTLGWGVGLALNWWGVTRRPISTDEVDREMRRIEH
jgi:hypothetical protein